MGVLEIPLVDRNRRFTLLQLHNLPIPVLGTHVQVQYAFLPKYLAIDSSGQYVAYPTEDEILACSITRGGFCVLNTAILPTFNLQTYETALYQKNLEQTSKLCKIEISPSYWDNALSLRPNYWYVITRQPIVLHINCLQSSSYRQLHFPVDVVHLENDCEATSTTLTLPGHSQLIRKIIVF